MPELVVARYTEDLNWLRNLSANRVGQSASLRVTIYDKSPDASAGPDAVRLPNVGREAHTYLHHIVSRYDTLAEWTVFCQGKPFDHAFDFKKFIRAFVSQPVIHENFDRFVSGFYWLGHLIDTDDKQGQRLFQPWSKNEDGRGLDLRGFHRALFDTDGPEFYTFVLGAQFAVHRNVVQSQPLAFYERALAVAITFPDAAHCFERSWDRVFGLTGIDPVWLAGRQTVYLKPMKHQNAVG
ncbi:DUF3431 domain-containing protein [Spirosoma taeanense]|uniref:DUF3431 domain-containing protein n=1 Tax=Spirosoma taeanense TaxID=2735870 RepID=A0A6M5Y2S6_9BACT|nr:DUF3431 domain-containing protein [Spirosoma taeanense]QJW88099.1 DUF3431 domain-containing protein [Spirosoma taeanense]